MEDEKGIVKKEGWFKKAVVPYLATFVVMGASSALIGNISLAQYPNNAQVVSIAKELDCDTAYMSKFFYKFSRLQNNGKNPIYVCFSDEISEKEREIATRSFDYMFGIVGKINPKYRYEIVDKGEFNKHFLETRIYYQLADSRSNNEGDKGFIDTLYNPFCYLTPTSTTFYHTISRVRTYNPTDEKDFEHVLNHELFHAFGINDVYIGQNTQKHQGNTFIKGDIGQRVRILTPNDIKCLIAIYAEKFDSESEKQEQISKFKVMIEEYEEYYYQSLADIVTEELSITDSIEHEHFKWFGQGSFKTLHDNTIHRFNYQVEVENDTFVLQVLDQEKNLLDSYQGEAIRKNGIIILKDVQLAGGLAPGLVGSPEGYIQDLVMVQAGGLISMVDIKSFSTFIGFTSPVRDLYELG